MALLVKRLSQPLWRLLHIGTKGRASPAADRYSGLLRQLSPERRARAFSRDERVATGNRDYPRLRRD